MPNLKLEGESKDCARRSEQQAQLLSELAAQRHKNVFVLFGSKLGDTRYPHSIPMRVLRRHLAQSLESLLQNGCDTFLFHSVSCFSVLCAQLLAEFRHSYPAIRYYVLPIHHIDHEPLPKQDQYEQFLSGAAARPFELFLPEDSNPAAYIQAICSICSTALFSVQPQEYTEFQQAFGQQTRIIYAEPKKHDLDQFKALQRSIYALIGSISKSFDYRTAYPVSIDEQIRCLLEHAERWNSLLQQFPAGAC